MPATQNWILSKGYDVAAAITAKRAVKFSAEETVTPVTAISDVPAGIAMFGVTTAEIALGKGASLMTDGIAIMEATAAITVGALVQMSANGRAAPYAGASGARILGRCTKGCANAAEEVSVALDLPGSLA